MANIQVEDIMENEQKEQNENVNNNEQAIAQKQLEKLTVQAFTVEQQQLYDAFMGKPFVFVPPPVFLDENMRKYREDVEEIFGPYTSQYRSFNQSFSLKNGDHIKTGEEMKKNSSIKQQQSRNKGLGIKIKVNNLKFMSYTLYSCLIESLRTFRDEDAMPEKLKRCNATLKKKLQDFYRQANDLKEDYRRIQIMHLLENQIQVLDTETKSMNQKVNQIEQFAQSCPSNLINQ